MKKPYAIWLTDLHLELDTIEIVKSIMNQAILACGVAGVKVIILGGDIFDSRKGQPQDVLNAWLDILDDCQAKSIMVYCIPGNHDKTDYSKDKSFLDVYNTHSAFTLYSHETTLITSDVTIHFLPYYHEDIYIERLKNIEAVSDGILITHIGVDGAMANGNFAIESELKGNLFDKFDYVYIGHYHNRHELSSNIIYTGSCYPRNFGEDNNKGLGILMSDGSMDHAILDFPKYLSESMDKVTLKTAQGLVEGKRTEDHLRVIAKEIEPEAKELLKFHGIKTIIETSVEIIKVSPSAKVFTDKELLEEFKGWSKKKKPKFASYGKEIIEKVLA